MYRIKTDIHLYSQRLIFTIFLAIIGLQNIFAQPHNFELKQITQEHGLPGVSVRAIYQDSKNILWFGIESAGLCKYDGVSFLSYSNNSKDSSSLGNNFVNTICEDTDGYLWVGTENGLYKFDRNKEKFKSFFSIKNNKNSLCGNQIFSIKMSTNGEIWVGTNNGVNIYDKKNDRFIRLPIVENGNELNVQVNSICFESNKDIWLGTSGGLLKIEHISHKFSHWINNPQQSNSLPNNQIKDLCFDHQGLLWIVTGVGCVKYDPKSNCFYDLKELNRLAFASIYGNPADMICDRKGFIWIGAEGMVIIDPKNNSFKIYQKSFEDPNGLKSNDIRAICEDKSGLIWIGTKFEGLQIYNDHKEQFPHWKNQINNDRKGLNDKTVMAICEDKNQNLYFGTKEGGLNVFDRKTGAFTYFMHDKNNPASISGNYIYALLSDHDDNVFLAASNYLEIFDIRRKTFTHHPINAILCLLEDSKGRLWVGRKPGLFIFDKKNYTLLPFKDLTNVFPERNDLDIYRLYEDKEGTLWIGTYRDGLFEYNPNTGKVIQYKNDLKDTMSLSCDMVRSIYEDKMGHLWVGTKLQGLNLFDRTNKRFIRYTMFDGLPSNSIYCILEDANGNLWLGTHNGISKFNPVAKIFQNFNKDYGLQDNVFTSEAQCRSKSGELIFGGNNGFNIFYPEKIKKEIYYAPLVITSIKIFDQTICRDLSKPVKLTLTYSQNYISFGFALLDYFNPLQNEYQYKMEGVDNNWVLSGNRHYASYSSLKPGRYIFYAKASNAYGTWNNNDISVEITILPPWWQTWWFKLMFFLILIVSISFAYYLRIKRYREKQKELTVLVRQRTKEISHANDILLERQARIEEYAKELLTRTENLREANDVLLDNQKLIEKQAEQLQDSNQQLKYTNEQLAILNSTKDRFFSIIAHDLRNPFNTVSGFAEVLQREYKMLPPEKIERFLKLIYISSTNGNSLLENLLQWSRAQTGSITFEPSKLNLSAIADATINMMSGDAVHKNIKIYSPIDQGITVFADENMLKTIFRNLVSNGIKFTPEMGDITITSTLQKSQVEVTVADTGVGIPSENIAKLFRIETAVTTKGTANETGTGLGLILCKEFIEKHNGKIWVESEVGKGSKFKFTLPLP